MKKFMTVVTTRIIHGCFYALFFAAPLLLTKYNFELFEFNKMLFVYAVTIVAVSSWLVRSVYEGKLTLYRSPLTLPLMLFLLFQVVSTVFSIDPHLSIWGFYGRFNGGLLSTICYILLFLVATNTLSTRSVRRLLLTAIFSGLFVAAYAVAQRYGVDAHLWVQDVQNRVFSTLGQPNWLAAYMAILLPIAVGVGIHDMYRTALIYLNNGSSKKFSTATKSIANPADAFSLPVLYWALPILFYATLLFTKSRSGFLGFWAANACFIVLITVSLVKSAGAIRHIRTPLVLVNGAFILLTIFIGSPFSQINAVTAPARQLIAINTSDQASTPQPSADFNSPESAGDELESKVSPRLNITESGDIRKIVWEGSINAVSANPVIGYGPATFAWVYYRYKPIAHNTTSEWDFLYNKAHNEYLNYAATSGLLGLGAYMAVIFSFSFWALKLLVFTPPHEKKGHLPLQAGLFSAWISILITNFFGFSVVVTNLFLFLIPALFYHLTGKRRSAGYTVALPARIPRKMASAVIIVCAAYLLGSVGTYWLADFHYNAGVVSNRLGKYHASLEHLLVAASLRPFEPNYHDELSETFAYLALGSFEMDEVDAGVQFAQAAIDESDTALSISPYNVSFWKNRTRVFYALSQIDDAYYIDALTSIEAANKLAPTDAKILYNLGLLQNAVGDNERAIETLKTTISLKPDYRDAAWALALYYEEEGDTAERDRWLLYIVEKIEPNDGEVRRKLGI